ncbi:helix-turn-helix transcriptional regulator (plasmid) [Rhizobium leguminosarum bv. trifolii]|nr:helix-turn-helix transcriptional regulator [Rhizobium leguminosarum bv. trifolii]
MKRPFRTLPCDVMRPDCPARALLSLLAEKWALLLIPALSEGPKRTGALKRRVGGISEKMLVQTLRRLENMKLVARHVYDEVPPRVEYRLTELGWSLSPLVTALDSWVERHAFDIPLIGSDREKATKDMY